MPKRRGFLLIAGAAAAFSGCTVGPDYQVPDVTIPQRFDAQGTADPKSAALAGPDASVVLWWRSLKDPTLNALVERAVASNFDIEAALARVQKARMEEVTIMGAALPQVGISAGIAA